MKKDEAPFECDLHTDCLCDVADRATCEFNRKPPTYRRATGSRIHVAHRWPTELSLLTLVGLASILIAIVLAGGLYIWRG